MTTNTELKQQAAQVTFKSPDAYLNDGFVWAKEQALAYAHFGEDPVGLWYEAALPNRQAFCMRDVAHHSLGASVLGLSPLTKNMMIKFAENIAKSRDWCTFWEITKADEPAEVDYDSDEDFWYNLPANFDVIDACYRQYLWTGDTEYLKHPEMNKFYQLTMEDFVQTWDKDGDGILEYYREYGRRGLATYNEAGLQPLHGGDMIAAQIVGYLAYSRFLELDGKTEQAKLYESKARKLEQFYESNWWNEKAGRFYGALLQDRSYLEAYNAEGTFLPLYFGTVKNLDLLNKALIDLEKNGVANVEGKTYLPDTYYRFDRNEQGYRELKELVDPALDRRDYPEVSYCVVGAYAAGLMGISADGQQTITTLPRLTEELPWAELSQIPILDRTIAVRHNGDKETTVTSQEGEAFTWKAAFNSEAEFLIHNGQQVKAQTEIAESGIVRSFILVEVAKGDTHQVSIG